MIKADVVVVGEQFLGALDPLTAQGLAVCTVESLRRADPIEFDADHADEADIALRQLTSGSTGVPKAVEISHAQSRRECRRVARWAGTRHRHGRLGELAAAVS